MTWKVLFHPLTEKDFKKFPPKDQKKVVDTCLKKLSLDPQGYGEPLRGNFHGFWKLKVLDYRVVYQIKKQEVQVWVIKVGFRRGDEVYRDLTALLDKLGF